MNARTTVVVQARVGSTRLPGKVLADLAGRTLLERVVERIEAANTGATVVVATTTRSEDDPIRALCRVRGLRCFSGHPTDLLARHLGAAREWRADVVVKIPSDCPLIDPAVIRRVIGFYEAHAAEVDFVSNLLPPSYPDGNDVEVMPSTLLEHANERALAPHEREHTTPWFWEQPHRLRVANVTSELGRDLSQRYRFTVDYPEDYALVSALYDALWSERTPTFGLDAILHHLEARPELDAQNAQHRGDTWQRRRQLIGSHR